MMECRFEIVGSLEKVRPCAEPNAQIGAARGMSLLRGDRLSFQIAYQALTRDPPGRDWLFFDVQSDDVLDIALYKVSLAPVRVPRAADADDDYLMSEPGLMPDILGVYDPGEGARVLVRQWRAIWVAVSAGDQATPGKHTLVLTCRNSSGEIIWQENIDIDVIAQALPEQTLRFTQWFHADCLADYYHVEAFSEEHWAIIEKFVALAAGSGVNMLLTPVFTPPLDTSIGGERTTVQLVDVAEDGDGYRFSFDKLDRWIDLCDKCGIKYLEVCHLFTQWGAQAAPKIMVRRGGRLVRAFGWDTPATGDAYQAFLRAFLPTLTEHLRKRGVLDRTYFHISDEPADSMIENYRAARSSVLPLLKGCQIIDALASFEMYKEGLAPKPVVATNHIEPFLDARVPGLWAYYCCGQGRDVGNRFIAMPSYRNRILGVQLYLFHIEGFLQWGYNFYNSQLSKKRINPFIDTDADEAFPSGDAFSVYPGEDGAPIPSIRLMVFKEALDDLRALSLLESLRGREYVVNLIREEAGMDITFSAYPRKADFLYRLRARVNFAIAQR